MTALRFEMYKWPIGDKGFRLSNLGQSLLEHSFVLLLFWFLQRFGLTLVSGYALWLVAICRSCDVRNISGITIHSVLVRGLTRLHEACHSRYLFQTKLFLCFSTWTTSNIILKPLQNVLNLYKMSKSPLPIPWACSSPDIWLGNAHHYNLVRLLTFLEECCECMHVSSIPYHKGS